MLAASVPAYAQWCSGLGMPEGFPLAVLLVGSPTGATVVAGPILVALMIARCRSAETTRELWGTTGLTYTSQKFTRHTQRAPSKVAGKERERVDLISRVQMPTASPGCHLCFSKVSGEKSAVIQVTVFLQVRLINQVCVGCLFCAVLS